MIIDAHVHIGETEKNEYSFTFDSFYIYMMKNNIDKTVALPSISNYELFSISNDKLLKTYNNFMFRSFFYLFFLAHPEDPETLNQIRDEKINGIKYHPSVTRYTIDNISMKPFLEVCQEKKYPVLVHCGRDKVSDIKYLINAAKNYPDINFIGAHLGGNATDIIQASLESLSKENLKNIYLDTSAGKLPRLIEDAVKVLGEDKIIFGSDEPYADIRIEKACVELANLTENVKDKIFYKNICSLLNS